MPSFQYDISIKMFNSRCESRPPSYGAILASAAFLVIFRGLPLDVVEVEHGGKMSLVTFLNNNEKMSINLQKCKQLLEKQHIFSSGIEKIVKKIFLKHDNKIALTTSCKDAELFEESHLSALLLGDENADFALAYSKKDDRIIVKPFAPKNEPDLALSAAIAAYESIGERKEMTVSFDVLQNPCKSSEIITLAPTFSGTKISINATPLMKFDTPHL
jgi:hypothetical protein